MSKCERIPEQVIAIIGEVESDENREINKARTEVCRRAADLLEKYDQNSGSSLLLLTPKITVEYSGISYSFWLREENNEGVSGWNPPKHADLLVQPSDDSRSYKVFTIHEDAVYDKDKKRVEDIEVLSKLSAVLNFMGRKLKQIPSPQKPRVR